MVFKSKFCQILTCKFRQNKNSGNLTNNDFHNTKILLFFWLCFSLFSKNKKTRKHKEKYRKMPKQKKRIWHLFRTNCGYFCRYFWKNVGKVLEKISNKKGKIQKENNNGEKIFPKKLFFGNYRKNSSLKFCQFLFGNFDKFCFCVICFTKIVRKIYFRFSKNTPLNNTKIGKKRELKIQYFLDRFFSFIFIVTLQNFRIFNQ